MQDDNIPTTLSTDSPSVEMSNDNIAPATNIDPFEEFVAQQFADPQDESKDASVVAESEEPSNPEEEPEEDADDVSDVEADEIDQSSEDEPQEEVEQATDFEEYVPFDENKDMVIEFPDGEFYSVAQLNAMRGQFKAAGGKAREVAQKEEALAQREASIQEMEKRVESLGKTFEQSDRMAELRVQGNKLQQEITEARKVGDAYEMTMKQAELQELGAEYQQLNAEVAKVQQQEAARKQQAFAKDLKDSGYGYLLSTNEQSKAWSTYASSNLSQEELMDVLQRPSLAKLVEKARKYDSLETKKAKRLTPKKQSLTSGANKRSNTQVGNKKPVDPFDEFASKLIPTP